MGGGNLREQGLRSQSFRVSKTIFQPAFFWRFILAQAHEYRGAEFRASFFGFVGPLGKFDLGYKRGFYPAATFHNCWGNPKAPSAF